MAVVMEYILSLDKRYRVKRVKDTEERALS